MGCILFEIPSDVFDYVCSEWLLLKDVSALDCSICGPNRFLWEPQLQRKHMFHDLYSHCFFIVHLKDDCRMQNGNFFYWLYLRGIFLKKLTLEMIFFERDMRLKSIVNIDQVEELRIQGTCYDLSFLSRCKNLTKLF